MSEISSNNKNLFKKIKSKYILKFIFSYLNEKTKLEIIKYNKTIQNIINIDITNYKFLSRGYIIYESNKKGKKYDIINDYLEFEGEYLNGKRNGKGKEYYLNGRLMFEGEYINGLKWNGKGYDIHNNIVYELKNGNGYVKEYYKKGKLFFEGEYLNGKKMENVNIIF